MITAAAEAPFLTGLRRAPREVSPAGDDPAETEIIDDSFPDWYQANLTDDVDDVDDVDGADGADGADDARGDETPEPAPDPMTWVDELAAVRQLESLDFGAVTVLAGDNGSGKSTLLEAIAIAAGFNPEGGSRNLMFSTWDTHTPLADELVLEWRRRPRWGWFLRAESFYGMASHIAADDDPETGLAAIFPDLHGQSHGESFLALAESRFTGTGLYLFDEPESALSIQGLARLVEIMAGSLEAGGQFIVSTHSPLLMALPGAVIWEVSATDGLRRRGFEDLESTRRWRSFWQDPAGWFEPTRTS